MYDFSLFVHSSRPGLEVTHTKKLEMLLRSHYPCMDTVLGMLEDIQAMLEVMTNMTSATPWNLLLPTRNPSVSSRWPTVTKLKELVIVATMETSSIVHFSLSQIACRAQIAQPNSSMQSVKLAFPTSIYLYSCPEITLPVASRVWTYWIHHYVLDASRAWSSCPKDSENDI